VYWRVGTAHGRDLQAEVIKRAQTDLDQSLQSELDAIAVKRLLSKAIRHAAITQTARDQNSDMIV